MEFLHRDVYGGPETVVLVTLDGGCNVLLLDDNQFANYRLGRGYSYQGGWTTSSPVTLRIPHYAHWHVVIDLGGMSGGVRVAIRVVKRSLSAG